MYQINFYLSKHYFNGNSKKNACTHFTRRKKAQKIKLFTKKNLAFKMLKGLILAQKIIRVNWSEI